MLKKKISRLCLNFEGRLWIHAAGKVPDPETIKAMEDFYREIYALNGITDLKFPEHYPVSRLLGIFRFLFFGGTKLLLHALMKLMKPV